MQYKHILAAVDLSPQSTEVVTRALEIATQNKASFDIVHVVEQSPVAYGGEFSIPINVNLEHAIETEARKQLSALSDKFKIEPKHQHVLTGSVKTAVVELAEQLKVDLIVAGTHGHHGIDILLGSRANAILHGAKCDVLVVRAKESK